MGDQGRGRIVASMSLNFGLTFLSTKFDSQSYKTARAVKFEFKVQVLEIYTVLDTTEVSLTGGHEFKTKKICT